MPKLYFFISNIVIICYARWNRATGLVRTAAPMEAAYEDMARSRLYSPLDHMVCIISTDNKHIISAVLTATLVRVN